MSTSYNPYQFAQTVLGQTQTAPVDIEALRADLASRYGVASQQTQVDPEYLAKWQAMNSPQVQASENAPYTPSWMEPSLNPITNFQRDIVRIGTGLINQGKHIINNPVGSAKSAIKYLLTHNPREVNRDFFDAQLSNYNLSTAQLVNQPLSESVKDAVAGIYTNPASAAIDLISLGGLHGADKVAKAVNKTVGKRILPTSVGSDVEKGILASRADVSRNVQKYREKLDPLKGLNDTDLAKVVESAETGSKLPEHLKPYKEALREQYYDFDNLVKNYSPQTYVAPDELSIIQKIARDENKTVNYVRKEVTPYLQMADDELSALAKSNKIADKVVEAKQLYNKGEIFPVTHGIAEVVKDAPDAIADTSNIVRNGRFSTREYGNAAYEDIAKQLQNPAEFLEGLQRQFELGQLTKELRQGKIGNIDVAPMPNAKPKDIIYIDADKLEADGIVEALNKASSEAKSPADIAVDKLTAQELAKQLQSGYGSSAFKGVAKDVESLTKATALGSGAYIFGNVGSGAINALIESGAMLPVDAINALRTRGQLAKNVGAYRDVYLPKVNPIKTQGLKQIGWLGERTGGQLLRRADAAVQNGFAEIGLHRALRKAGISAKDRSKILAEGNLDKQTLGQAIQDARNAALMNSENTIFSNGLTELGSMTNPFWRWTDTAARNTIRQFETHPFITNMVLSNYLANIGLNREMQERANIGIRTDSPMKSFVMDARSGQLKTFTTEYIAQLNTAKLLADPKEALMSSGDTTIGWVINLLKGKDKYGRAFQRAQKSTDSNLAAVVGGVRKTWNPKTGEFTRDESDIKVSEYINEFLHNASPSVALLNKTVLPIAAEATGNVYLQPYAGSTFGTFLPKRNFGYDMKGRPVVVDRAGNIDDNANAIFGGNINRPRMLQDIESSMTSSYVAPYYEGEERPIPSSMEIRQILRNNARGGIQRGGYYHR